MSQICLLTLLAKISSRENFRIYSIVLLAASSPEDTSGPFTFLQQDFYIFSYDFVAKKLISQPKHMF